MELSDMVGYFITLYAMLCHAMPLYSILFYSALFSSIQSCATCAYKEHKQIIKELKNTVLTHKLIDVRSLYQ